MFSRPNVFKSIGKIRVLDVILWLHPRTAAGMNIYMLRIVIDFYR